MQPEKLMKILMVDVDGVLINGRPVDGLPPFTQAERDLCLDPAKLQQNFFAVHWSDIVTGHKPIEPSLQAALTEIAPHLGVEEVLRYWFENDSRLDERLLEDLALLRASGTKIHLATNQEHRRAEWLMQHPALAGRFDGIFYSAALGHKKPERAFFEMATQGVGADPAEANIEAALRYGWMAVQWLPGMSLQTVVAEVRSRH